MVYGHGGYRPIDCTNSRSGLVVTLIERNGLTDILPTYGPCRGKIPIENMLSPYHHLRATHAGPIDHVACGQVQA